MKIALSRKNAWEQVPRSIKAALAPLISAIPPPYLLGTRFRRYLQFIEKAQWWSSDQARSFQLSELKRICRIAYDRTPYYRKLFDACGFHPEDLENIEDIRRIPVLTRESIRENLTDMCTMPLKSLGVDYASTGGTSGKPLEFYIGADRSSTEYPYLVSGWKRVGYRLGMPMAVFRGRVIQEDRTGFRYEYDPILKQHYYSNFHMTDAYMRKYLDHIRSLGDCFLHVYPSSAAALDRFVRRSGIETPANVRGLVAESEIVYPDQRRMIEETFRCRLFSSYGLTEKVVAAAECEGSTDYHIWPTYGFLELLDEEGREVCKPGRSGEIVGTGFINTVTPFIRYRTGDYATYVAERCDLCGRSHVILKDIVGHRIQETLVMSDGSRTTWTALNMHDNTFKNVLQFQFYQDTPGIAVLRIVPAPLFNKDDQQRILRNLGYKVDGRLRIKLENVSSIQTTVGGKAIYVDQRIQDEERR